MFFLLKKGFSKKHVITFKNKLSRHTKKVRPGIQFAEKGSIFLIRFKSVIFKKQRQCGKNFFDIKELFIHCNTYSCREHVIVVVNIYLYRCVS